MIESRDRRAIITHDFVTDHAYEVTVVAVGPDGTRQPMESSARNVITIRGKTTAPGLVQSLTAVGFLESISLYWVKPADYDLSYVEIWRSSTNNIVTATKIAESSGITYIDAFGLPNATRYYWVRAINSSGIMADFYPTTAAGVGATSFGVTVTDIDDFSITASKLFTKIPVVEGDTWTDNSPGAGYAAWGAHNLYYNGVRYAIAAGSSNKHYIWWDQSLPNAYYGTDVEPTMADVLFIIATNISGIHNVAWNSIANQVIGSAYIKDLAVIDAKIVSLTANKLTAGTIDASVITVTNLSADNIVTGTLSGISVMIGTGNNVFKADANGIYLGHATFASAPFRVTPAGAVTATSIAITGGVIDGTSTIGGRTASTLATAIDASGHFADAAISTATNTILGAFTFGVSGAVQIGTYSAGVTGDIRISPTGILGRDKTNSTTFSINATTGVAVLNGLVVGTNVGLGTAQDSAGVTTIIGNTVTTSYVNALNVNAATVSASISITTPTITGGTITIGTGNNVFIAGANGIQLGHATFASAPFRVTMAGALTAASATITGSTISTPTITGIQAGSEIAIQGWMFDVSFTATDYRTVAWGTADLTLLDGTVYHITAGTTGSMATLTYIYFDVAASTTLLQVTTTAATAVGTGKILVGVAAPNGDVTSEARYQMFGGAGKTQIFVDHIAANAASTNEFVSNSAQIKNAVITNAKIDSLDAGKITTGTLTGRTVQTAAGTGQRIILSQADNTLRLYNSTNVNVAILDDNIAASSKPGLWMGSTGGGYLGLTNDVLGGSITKVSALTDGKLYMVNADTGSVIMVSVERTGASGTGAVFQSAIASGVTADLYRGNDVGGIVFQVTYQGVVKTTESYFVGANKVVGAQGATVANATDAASVILRLNELLARCRAHGLIAT